jgi:protocatechuate 3,4-dioxygenase beta subunit
MRNTQTKPPICLPVLVLLVIISGVRANEPSEVRGRVVDEAGMPVADAAVGCFWRANGSSRDRDGKPYDLTKTPHSALWRVTAPVARL